MAGRRVYLGIPCLGSVSMETLLGVSNAFARAGRAGIGIKLHCEMMSILTMCFNTLWAAALNARKTHGITHFVMLHSDIGPADGWLETLLDEMDAHQAGLLSCVVPIKDMQGATSTALIDPRTKELERLTARQIQDLPDTFDGSLFPEKILCVNTGLFVADFRQPWVEQVWFENIDKIYRGADGQFEARTMSEDWDFSVKLEWLGVKVCATQKIGLTHFGRLGFEMPARHAGPPEEDDDDDFELANAHVANLHAHY